MNHIAYYRVSTERQGHSGLGLEAQQQAVERFLADRGRLVDAYTEIESGRRNNRPKLQAALDACRARGARLVIAKLDRLARNVHFISGLLESGVDFVAVDMPEANKLTIHILAAVAEHECELISQRTKAALAAAKARGVKLGSPTPKNGARQAARVLRAGAVQFARGLRPVIEQIQAQGITSLHGIARALNERGYHTRQGRAWRAVTVGRLLQRIGLAVGDDR